MHSIYFLFVSLIETSNDENKKKIKKILKCYETDLKQKIEFQGAKLLIQKLAQI